MIPRYEPTKIVESCANCHFSRTGIELGYGHTLRRRCCYYPPRNMVTGRDDSTYFYDSLFPEVLDSEWCGHWQRGVM